MYILNKYIDWLFAGGLSLAVYGVIYVFDINLIAHGVGAAAFLLANVINHPHFMASYGFLYFDERKKLTSNIYYLFVSYLIPIVLILLFAYALFLKEPHVIGYLVNLMFFMVGLHYVRQIYGIGLISLAKMQIFLPNSIKKVLNYTLMPVWFISYLNGNTATRETSFYGISYQTLGIPKLFQEINSFLFFISVLIWLAIVAYIVYKYKKWPVTLIIVLASISLWHFPSFYDSGFAYLIPLFHSLQYLLIVIAVKRTQIGQLVNELEKYLKWLVYIILIGVVAYCAFRFIPETLDKTIKYDHAIFGNSLYLAMFLIFINIHHYFIDALIWRKGSGVAKSV